MRLLLFGTGLLKCCQEQKFTIPLLILGRLDVYSTKQHIKEFYSVEIHKSTRSSRFSKSWEPQTKTYGKTSVNLKTSNRLSPNGEEAKLMNFATKFQPKVLTCSKKCLFTILYKESLLKALSTTRISTTSIRVNLLRETID